MPQANRKRGRRGQKRKADDVDDEALREEGSSKRRRPDGDVLDGDADAGATHEDSMEPARPAAERPFFGMLDEDEQEYFRRADAMLEGNSFGDDDERALFLANVYREADGKELKIAMSQSCSRLMERLIQLSTPSQLKALFVKFRGKYVEAENIVTVHLDLH